MLLLRIEGIKDRLRELSELCISAGQGTWVLGVVMHEKTGTCTRV